jgi:glycosyltransferase involved in cell wall biosynthesis
MKILLSNVACSPIGGSELYFGWSAVKCLAQDHELWVLTNPRHRPELEVAQAQGSVPPTVKFIYVSQIKAWHQNQLKARIQAWKEYIQFTGSILAVAQKLHAQEQFDLVHHVTYATWRVASPLWRLGVPFVFGPIGGNEHFPLSFLRSLSATAATFEIVRMLAGGASRFSPAVRTCIRRSAHMLVANEETESLIRNLRGSSAGITRLTPAFYSEEKIREFAGPAVEKNVTGPIRLFAGGKLEGRKGVALALQALARVKQQGVKFQYRLGGEGPEAGHLQQLIVQLGLKDEVILGEPLRGPAYLGELRETHVFLLPSFRESAGLTMMEAMLSGCVPIVADCAGPGNIVTADCGYKIPVSNAERMIDEMARVIVELDANRKIILKKGTAARERIATAFSEQNYRRTINAVYASVKK